MGPPGTTEDLQKLLQHLCRRPEMYTPHGNFSDVISFINGFIAARQPPGTKYGDDELTYFSVWMRERFGLVPPNWVWWNVLLYGFEKDQDRALAGLPALYDEYVAAGCPQHPRW